MARGKDSERVKTGNWRPFRPNGMTDMAWETMLKVHRYPNAGMSLEERRHCLGPLLFGKGGPRFSGYGRGWIQEAVDSRFHENGVKSHHFIDAKDCEAIKEAIDYYNGGDYSWARENGFVKEAMEEMKRATGIAEFSINGRFDKAVEYNWYRLSYGAFGGAIDDASDQWVESGFSAGILYFGSKTHDVKDAFENVEGYDVQGIDCCLNVRDLNDATNLCPIYPNKSLFGGIDCAMALMARTGMGDVARKKIRRFLKRAMGELHKRREAVVKTAKGIVNLAGFDLWMEKRAHDIGNILPETQSHMEALIPAKRPKPKFDDITFGSIEEDRRRMDAEDAEFQAQIDALYPEEKDKQAQEQKSDD